MSKTPKKCEGYDIRHQVDDHGELTLDEVIAHSPAFVHIEQMDKGHWWIGIDVGKKQRIMVNFTARGTIKGTAYLD